MNRAALSARIALGSMQASDAQLAEMGVSLSNALQAPPGSDARRASLEAFNQYHRLADDYSMPEDLNARKLLDRPERFSAAGDIQVAAGENSFRIRLQHQPIHLGAGGLDLPQAGAALPSDPGSAPIIADPDNASDDEIRAMQDVLRASRARLRERQAVLNVDIMAVERQEEQGVELRSKLSELASDIESADLARRPCWRSRPICARLALSGLAGLNETRSLALQLLG